MSSLLLIFTKNPRLGQVKTRLAQTVGDAEALRIYRLLLDQTRAAALGVHTGRWLFYSDAVEPDDDWPNDSFQKFVQCPGDLGMRMADAFQRAFAAGASKAVIIGCDCPGLSGALLQQAFDALDTAGAVLGPALDGGYYLLGLKQPTPALFEGIAWSTPEVCAETLRKMEEAGRSCFLLPELMDVDTEDDWRRVVAPSVRRVTPSVRRREKTV